ncbi:prolyl oligopeptidase [Sphingomonas kaistensis]|uniref:prolyl oligopeptidase n=1 Tax=Sphingomonas kaistensis TaxID=298708 RepID=A0A7X6BHS9_9SPHN|nr:prolyl oligopeptidase family serine peptidase [Sphingomonas kaistensis]NJC06845.1 prolyl oligopeptidase [Sphingomonas kaistensis]
MRKLGTLLGASAALITGAVAHGQERQRPAEWQAKPPQAQVRSITEDFFGTKLVDNYRYMETAGDQETLGWMKAQGQHTRSVLDAIPARAAYLQKVSALGSQFGFINGYSEAGGRAFYLERAPGSDVFNLMVRESNGSSRALVDVAALLASTGKPHAINYYRPSDDGKRVAVGVSVGGNENADLTVMDVTTGQRIAGPVPNARFANPQFMSKGGLSFTISQELKPGQPKTDTFLNRQAVIWDMKGSPVPIAGGPVTTAPKIRPDESPYLILTPGSRTAVMLVNEGVKNEVDLYVASEADAAASRANWRKVADRQEGVTDFTVKGERIYLLSNSAAPTFRVLSMPVSGSAATAQEILPARADRVLQFVGAASDGLYVAAREGVYGKLLRIPLKGGAAEEMDLPIKGNIAELFTDPQRPGAVVSVSGWTAPPALYRYDGSRKAFKALPSGARPNIDFSRYATHDLRARAKDGVEVPLSVVSAAGPRAPRPMLLQAYGSYGISQLPGFSTSRLALIDEGGTAAVCHVRGGGELGEAWRLGGKDANKPNTWRDLIACAEHLVRDGWTTPDQLAIIGGSAGGITVGRALIERPDLFAAVVSAVPMASAIRAEFQQNGPVNTVEFGTIKDPTGFKNLLAMDAYYTVENGKAYPPVMFTTGLNDTRVDSWQPAKAAARMQAAGSPNPVLLRVEIEGGHGGGATKKQADELQADVASFMFWRSGRPGWQPVQKAR